MVTYVLLIVLIIVLLGGGWGFRAGYAAGPAMPVLWSVLLVLLILLMLGGPRIGWW